MGVLKEKSYGNINIYNEIVSFHAILRQSNLFSEKRSCDIVKNVYGGILWPDLDRITCRIKPKNCKKQNMIYPANLMMRPVERE